MSQQSTKNTENPTFVIAIGRQFGCGAHDTGRWLANQLGIRYYDKTILSEAANELGFDKRIFDMADEKRPSWFRSLLQFNYGTVSPDTEFPAIGGEGVYNMQSAVIKQLPEKGSCIIVGRTADYLLRDHPRILSIFLHAPLEERIKTIIARGEADNEEHAAELARKMDKKREDYYNYYTPRRWGRADTYHLTLDTSRFSPALLLSVIQSWLSGNS